MLESKVPASEYVKLSPAQRLAAWRWWFIVLLLLALLGGGWALLHAIRDVAGHSAATMGAEASIETVAFVQSAGGSGTSAGTATGTTATQKSDAPAGPGPDDASKMRPYIMLGILGLIGIITLVCLWVALFSSNASSVTTASDILKTCIGFLIGVATNYLKAGP